MTTLCLNNQRCTDVLLVAQDALENLLSPAAVKCSTARRVLLDLWKKKKLFFLLKDSSCFPQVYPILWNLSGAGLAGPALCVVSSVVRTQRSALVFSCFSEQIRKKLLHWVTHGLFLKKIWRMAKKTLKIIRTIAIKKPLLVILDSWEQSKWLNMRLWSENIERFWAVVFFY